MTSWTQLDDFTLAHIEAALWITNDESDETGGVPLDMNYSIDDLAPETLEKFADDCKRFQEENAADIDSNDEQAGHDFWMTRNGHGCGFWDGDWEEEAGERLTAASEKFGEVWLYVGDNGLIYC
jgi:hypothetical protein